MFAANAPQLSLSRGFARGTCRVRRTTSRVCVPRAPTVANKSKATDDVDWTAKTKELTAERVLEQCLEAIANGDEDRLQSCLLELETPEDTMSVAKKAAEATKDKFWQEKLSEIAASRVLDNCMSAVMMGDVDEIEACMLDANVDSLLDVDCTTAEDGSKTFRFGTSGDEA